jgi:Uncharacterized protein conserved in bacteria
MRQARGSSALVPPRSSTLRAPRRDPYVPTIVIWECSLLARVSRINLRRTVRAFFDDLFSNPAYQPVDITPQQIYLADELRFNRDPFDALIVRRRAPSICRSSLVTPTSAVRAS